MNLLMPLAVGALVAAGLYMMMRRSMLKLVIGLSLLSHAANLLIFTSGGLVRAEAPLIAANAQTLSQPYADPLPQALILTAIVISFGLTAFTIGLIYRCYREIGTDNLGQMTSTEE